MLKFLLGIRNARKLKRFSALVWTIQNLLEEEDAPYSDEPTCVAKTPAFK